MLVVGVDCLFPTSGEERVIGFASRTLTKSERNYSVIKKELISVVFFVLSTTYWGEK